MSLNKNLQRAGLLLLVGTAGLLALLATNYQNQKERKEVQCLSQSSIEINSKRSLGLIIKDRKLLALRLDDEGNYSVPGGHIDSGETPESSLSRELREEIKISTESSDFEFFKVDCESKKNEKEKIFYHLVKSWDGEITQVSSGDRLKWVDYKFEADKKADTDLKLALYYLKQANLID